MYSFKNNFYLVIEAPDHVYVWGKTYTCHTNLSERIPPPPPSLARSSSGCNDFTRRVLPEFQLAEPGLRHIHVKRFIEGGIAYPRQKCATLLETDGHLHRRYRRLCLDDNLIWYKKNDDRRWARNYFLDTWEVMESNPICWHLRV